MTNEQEIVKESFFNLRNKLIKSFEKIDGGKFNFKNWKHSGSGGGTMAIIKGKVIEKGGGEYFNCWRSVFRKYAIKNSWC